MQKVKVIKASCCGANELLKANAVVGFLIRNKKIEIGVGVSREKSDIGSPRFSWLLDVFDTLNSANEKSRIALHVNGDWAKEIIASGCLPEAIEKLLEKASGTTRLQLNAIGSGFTLNDISPIALAKLISKLEETNSAKFIIPYNEASAKFVSELSTLTKHFDVLYDASFGYGKEATEFVSLFPEQLQGYAGGLGPQNIQAKLKEISKAQTQNVEIWVDAEGKLRDDNLNTLNLSKAQMFADSAFITWKETETTTDTELSR